MGYKKMRGVSSFSNLSPHHRTVSERWADRQGVSRSEAKGAFSKSRTLIGDHAASRLEGPA